MQRVRTTAHNTTIFMPETCGVADNGDVMSIETLSPMEFLTQAITDLEWSIARGGWAGPARMAYDDLATEFRSRLIALAVRTQSIG